jgi:hypothetical protein
VRDPRPTTHTPRPDSVPLPFPRPTSPGPRPDFVNPTVNTLLRYARAIGRKINVAPVKADPVKA